MNRRTFLKRAGVAAAAIGSSTGLVLKAADKTAEPRGVWIIPNSNDAIVSAAPVQWALGELRDQCKTRGIKTRTAANADSIPDGDILILLAGTPITASIPIRQVPELIIIMPSTFSNRPALLLSSTDARGLMYAILEIADRVRFAAAPLAAFDVSHPITEQPANSIRSVARSFVSETDDKPWFNDRAMWTEYFSMLAAHRFNRFNLTLGIGYDGPQQIKDSYFYFAYPFFTAVKGFDAKAAGLPDEERDQNLQTLRFISDLAAERGLEFHLGIWSHAYDFADSPDVNYPITGLTPDTHAPYCRDALALILKQCPNITGLTLRVHGESGVPEGNDDFWQTLFQAIKNCPRKIDLDLHGKSVTQEQIDLALATGKPVNISPKFWAEHMGMPYHQASIRQREMERVTPDEPPTGIGEGSRKFSRYGYADFLAEDRPFGILYRLWPGTRRICLWGDPVTAAAYSRASSFCSGLGAELYEPLAFKSRKGSARPGGRLAYADKSLNTPCDWQKYLYTYRVWGRLMFNPDCNPEVWQRPLRDEFQDAAGLAETALASATRILPMILTTHGPSAANARYWPEMYSNMPIVNPDRTQIYPDTPFPHRFGTVSPFDPQLFSGIEHFADSLLAGDALASYQKYSPAEVAQWLQDLAQSSLSDLAALKSKLADQKNPAFRRLQADIIIQSGIGLFFAWKFRCAALWRLHTATGDASALAQALKAYQTARDSWADMANHAKDIYLADITYDLAPQGRGHWLDRLVEIDGDLADMKNNSELQAPATPVLDPKIIQSAIQQILSPIARPAFACAHTPPRDFHPGDPLHIDLSLNDAKVRRVFLQYRRINQAQTWQQQQMNQAGAQFTADIPALYTSTRYSLQYYFQFESPDGGIRLHPGFDSFQANQPYFVVRRSTKA